MINTGLEALAGGSLHHKGLENHIRKITFFPHALRESFEISSRTFAAMLAGEAQKGMKKFPRLIRKSRKTGRLYYIVPNTTNKLRILTGTLTKAIRSLKLRPHNQNGSIFRLSDSGSKYQVDLGIRITGYDGDNYAKRHDQPGSRFQFFKPSFNRLRSKYVEIQATNLQKTWKKYGK